MKIEQIAKHWWRLTSEGEPRLVWFGYSKEELLGRFASWLRQRDLEQIRVMRSDYDI